MTDITRRDMMAMAGGAVLAPVLPAEAAQLPAWANIAVPPIGSGIRRAIIAWDLSAEDDLSAARVFYHNQLR